MIRTALRCAILLSLCTSFTARIASAQSCVTASQVTLSGSLRASNGIPSSNSVITLTPSQQGFIAGCGVNLPIATTCGTSTDGSVIQTGNPVTATVNTTAGGGSLPAGTYYTVFEFYDSLGHTTLPSPETRSVLSATGSLVVNPPPSGIPATAVGMEVFVATTSGAETLQGSTTGSASFVQSTALAAGASPATSNTTVCVATANDSVWPTGTGYLVGMVDSDGNTIPGYPMQWQLMGAGSNINLSNGLPYYHGVVTYPVPVLTQPQNHGVQSITGPLNQQGYNHVNLGKLGVGTSTPGFSIDVTNGLVNSNAGFVVNGTAGTAGNCLGSNGTAYNMPIPCITSIGTLFYQTVASNGTGQTQRPTLNFTPRFSLSDSTSPSETNVDLTAVVTAGSCTNCTVTYDAYGRVINASSGSGILAVKTQTSCALAGADADGQWSCSGTVTWPAALPNNTYQPQCMKTYPNAYCSGAYDCSAAGPTAIDINPGSITTNGFGYILSNHDSGSNGATFLLRCFAVNQ